MCNQNICLVRLICKRNDETWNIFHLLTSSSLHLFTSNKKCSVKYCYLLRCYFTSALRDLYIYTCFYFCLCHLSPYYMDIYVLLYVFCHLEHILFFPTLCTTYSRPHWNLSGFPRLHVSIYIVKWIFVLLFPSL